MAKITVKRICSSCNEEYLCANIDKDNFPHNGFCKNMMPCPNCGAQDHPWILVETDCFNKIAELEAKLKQENTCSNQLQQKCDDLRADKIELKAERAELIDLWNEDVSNVFDTPFYRKMNEISDPDEGA